MSLPVIKLAVVGHTNTGKTSLLRTLTRSVDFGEVSARPATTRHVEGTSILLGGQNVMELFDTPGLEDSIGLLTHLDSKGRRADGVEIIKQFLGSRKARGRFGQEAKALRQVLGPQVTHTGRFPHRGRTELNRNQPTSSYQRASRVTQWGVFDVSHVWS